jgi:hypothetical protein
MSLSFLFIAVGCWLAGIATGYIAATLAGDLTSLIDECKRGS